MEQLVRATSARVPPKLTACLNFFGGARLSRLNFNGGLPQAFLMVTRRVNEGLHFLANASGCPSTQLQKLIHAAPFRSSGWGLRRLRPLSIEYLVETEN